MTKSNRTEPTVEMAPKEERDMARYFAASGLEAAIRAGEKMGLERVDMLSVLFDLLAQQLINASSDHAPAWTRKTIATRHAQITGADIDSRAAHEEMMSLWASVAVEAALRAVEPKGTA